YASGTLRAYLSGTLGGSTVVALPPGSPAIPTDKAAAPRPAAGRADTWLEHLPAPPANRRLRIFATDPGASAGLPGFINVATVEVPWESRRGNQNLLTRGPVGEYLEVVDVDPASACAYDPVDLNNPFLLAQDGLAPSEGNPQFHQQMVY